MHRAPRFLILAAVVLALPLSAEQPTFRSGVRLVNVSVIAHDNDGRPVKT